MVFAIRLLNDLAKQVLINEPRRIDFSNVTNRTRRATEITGRRNVRVPTLRASPLERVRHEPELARAKELSDLRGD
jgi:hypothetical protein